MLSSFGLVAQVEYQYESVISDYPEWVRLMYQEDADPGEVVRAYDTYYSDNDFVKNTHTQYYKRWLRSIARDLPTNGRTQSDRRYLERTQAASAKLRSEDDQWVSLGPWDWDHDAADRSYAPGAAHVYTVEQALSDPDVLYAGTATAGLWKTTDRGVSWSCVTNDMLVNGLTALEINHQEPDVIYAELLSTIMKSNNGGSTWFATGDASFQAISMNVADIMMHPADTQEVWAATNDGLYRTTNGGTTWTKPLAGNFLEIEFHPTDLDTIYVVGQTGDVTYFTRSTDGGSTFVQQATGWPTPDTGAGEHQRRTEIAVSAADPDLVVALATGSANGGSGLYGLYTSNDAGSTWSFDCCGPQPAGAPSASNPNLMGWSDEGLDDGGQYYYDLALDISPTNPDSIFVAGVNLWISDDGGASFTCPAKWSHPHKPGYVHADVHDIHYYEATGEIWVAGDGGIFHSEDNGLSFTRKMTGISGTDFWGFGAGHRDGDVMLGGTYHNGTLLKDNDVYLNEWICTDGGDNYRGFVHPVLTRQAFSDYNIKELSGDRTVNNETRSFANKPNASYTIGQSSDLLFHPNYFNTWYSGSGTSLWKTTNNGYSFELIHDFGVSVAAMDICQTNPDVIYVTTFPGWWDDKKIWRTSDAGATWTEVTPPSSQLNGNLWVPFDIAVNPSDPLDVWIVRTSMYGGTNYNGSIVFRSVDGGTTWTNETGDFPTSEAPTSIAYQAGTDSGVYIGTRRTVYYKDNSLSGWELFNTGLPVTTASTRLLIHYPSQTIRNGTNRSVWERAVYDNGQPIAMAAVGKDTYRCLQDTIRFYDNSRMSDVGATWSWTFPGGTPSTSTDRDPGVIYQAPGIYDVELIVSDVHGSDTVTYAGMVKVLDECGLDGIAGLAMKTTAPPDYAQTAEFNTTVDSFTIAAWIRPNGTQSDYAAVVMNDDVTGGLNFREGNNTLGYHWPGGQWWWDSNLEVPSGVWSHVAMVVTPSQVKLYLNGQEAVHNISTSSVELTTLKIGSYQGWESRNYRGLIDEVSLFDRALTLDEIRAMRHLTQDPSSDSTMIGYYQFNTNGDEIFNKAGNADAVLNGSASKVRSRAAVGAGLSESMPITSTGTYDFQRDRRRNELRNRSDHSRWRYVGQQINARAGYLGSGCISIAYRILDCK